MNHRHGCWLPVPPAWLGLAMALVLAAGPARAVDPAAAALAGEWIANLDESDDIDELIEDQVSLRGGNIEPSPGMSRSDRGRYRGGPPEQAFYDHVSYDDGMLIEPQGEEFRLVHRHPQGDLERRFGRIGGRSVSASDARERKDYSFYYWDGNTLVVESRPRDSGRAKERYSIDPDSGRLKVELDLSPTTFSGRIQAIRYYDRAGAR